MKTRQLLLAVVLLFSGSVAPAWANERLMLADLKENETVVIDYFSVTGTRSISRSYFIRGGETKLLTAHRNIVEWRNRTPHIVNKYLLGDMELGRDDVLGLEALLVFYGAAIPGNCSTRDTIQVEYLRDGKSIGRFTYQDDTCFTKDKDGPAVRAKTQGRVSDELMDVLISFPQIDEKIRAANS